MNIEKLFGFLTEDYNLSYRYQMFTGCYGGNWAVQTYSFYNDSGCFTFYYIPQRFEMDFYCSSQFSTEREKLCERMVDIRSIEPEIWEKRSKIWIFNRPFFWWNNKKILSTFAEALKVHLEKDKCFFDLTVTKLPFSKKTVGNTDFHSKVAPY